MVALSGSVIGQYYSVKKKITYSAITTNENRALYKRHTIIPVELFHDSTVQDVVSVILRLWARIPNETANKAKRAVLRMMDVLGSGAAGA